MSLIDFEASFILLVGSILYPNQFIMNRDDNFHNELFQIGNRKINEMETIMGKANVTDANKIKWYGCTRN